jgi:hypothetical protein
LGIGQLHHLLLLRLRQHPLSPARPRGGARASGGEEKGDFEALRLTSNASVRAEVQPFNKDHRLRCADRHLTRNLVGQKLQFPAHCRGSSALALRPGRSRSRSCEQDKTQPGSKSPSWTDDRRKHCRLFTAKTELRFPFDAPAISISYGASIDALRRCTEVIRKSRRKSATDKAG